MKEKHPVLYMTGMLALGEFSVVGIVILGFFITWYLGFGVFDATVYAGALLGAAVMVLNFSWMGAYNAHMVDSTLAQREKADMTEEEATAFAAEHRKNLELRIRFLQVIRLFIMLGVLILAFLTPWFNVIATVIPMLAFRPLLLFFGRVTAGK